VVLPTQFLPIIPIFIAFVISSSLGSDTRVVFQYQTESSDSFTRVSGSLRFTCKFGACVCISSSGAANLSILSSILILLCTCEAFVDL
jgi:hypothetical protein